MSVDEKFVRALLVSKANQHGTLLEEDEAALRHVPFSARALSPQQDIVRQGDRPDVAVFVLKGTLARYHTLASGERQYLSIHIQGDMPDVQSLFIGEMDHSVCAVDNAEIAMFQHDGLKTAFLQRPGLAFAFWRMTLVDSAIFRQAITNNSARDHAARLAHFCCEHFVRARNQKLSDRNACVLPLNQSQLGQFLGMSHISLNRALQKLRRKGLLELRGGKLEVLDWPALKQVAGFDPTYLHLTKDSTISRTVFKGRRPK